MRPIRHSLPLTRQFLPPYWQFLPGKEKGRRREHRAFAASPAPPAGSPPRRAEALRLAEQRQDRLRRLIGDRQSLYAELLLDLQRLQRCAFVRHVGVDQLADTGGQRVGELLAE